MILGIFRRKKLFFIDENVLFSMSNTILNKLAILVIVRQNSGLFAVDLVIAYKVFFLMDLLSIGIVFEESK